MSNYFRVYLKNKQVLTYMIPKELNKEEIDSIEVLNPETNTIAYWMAKV